MAAAVTENRPLDPRKQGRFTLQLSERLTSSGSNSGSNRYSAVKFNHKFPAKSSTDRKTTLASSGNNDYSVTITDGDDERYKYTGSRKKTKRSYILVFDESSQKCTLEPLEDAYDFNLTSTPTISDRRKLAEQYPQLRPKTQAGGSKDDDDLFGPDEEEVDANNPYDYRNYADKAAPSPSISPEARPISINNTPRLPTTSTQRPSAVSKPLPAAARPKPAPAAARKPAANPLAPSKRKTPPPPAALADKKLKPVPTVRIDRKASIRPTDKEPESDEDEDDGGLTIDYGGSTPPKKKTRISKAVSAAGPISLRSAASSASPASRLHTPRQSAFRKVFEVEEIDFGALPEDDEEDDGYQSEGQLEDADADADVDAEGDADADGEIDADGEVDADADGDVEELMLGSPAQGAEARRESEAQRVEVDMEEQAEGEEDAEDDFEADFEADFAAEMEKALGAEGNESEESEEE